MRRLAVSCAFSAAALCSARAEAGARTEAGLFTALFTGTHVGADNPVPVSGVVPGAALEFTQRTAGFRLHLEGIPTVRATTSSTGRFGRSSASLALLNATALFDLDRQHRLRLGFGAQIVDVTNANGNNGDRDAVRVTSPILAAGATLPLAGGRFVEASAMVDPSVRGVYRGFDVAGRPRPDKPEAGAEVDYAAAYGWRHANVEYLIGGRGLSYHTRNTANGELVDRNVGRGVTFEVRFLLAK